MLKSLRRVHFIIPSKIDLIFNNVICEVRINKESKTFPTSFVSRYYATHMKLLSYFIKNLSRTEIWRQGYLTIRIKCLKKSLVLPDIHIYRYPFINIKSFCYFVNIFS